MGGVAGSILVVEDSRTQAAALRSALTDAGYSVVLARDAESALPLLADEAFDAVLSDVQMPGLSGYDLCRRIKADASLRHVHVVLLTSLDSPQDVLDGLAAGADNFVTMPFDRDVLLRRLQRLLGEADDAAPAARWLEEQVAATGRDHAIEYLSSTFEDYLKSRDRERKATAEARTARRSEQFLQAVLDGVSSCVGIVDREGWIVATNHEWREFEGRNPIVGPEYGEGTDFLEVCKAAAPVHRCARTLAADLPALLDGSMAETSVECAPHCADQWRCFRVRASRLTNGPSPQVVMSFHDVTELKLAEARLQHAAHHDPLTGLPNRALFLERLERALASARRRGGQVAVLFCDLDRFKLINDSLGHAAGDDLLVELATRIEGAIRDSDSAARFGGDEFAVLLDGVVSPRMIVHIVERIQQAVAAPLTVEGHEVVATMSIGIAVGPGASGGPDELLRDADTAMYRAKEAGKARFVMFDQEMHSRSVVQLRMQGELRQALAERQLFVLYQPIVELGARRILGAEALVRWQHPERGVVPPIEFIALAEETSLIRDLGGYVLDAACAELARWRSGGGLEHIRMAINLSGKQLGPSFVDEVKRALSAHALPASALEFELTESVVLTTGADVRATVDALKAMGLGLSMDDFGTGFSSLSALRELPFSTLKIDRSFVGTMDTDPQNRAIVQSLIHLGRGIGLEVVAEGVETVEQLQLLETMGCRFAQGYLFSRPIPGPEALAVMGTRWEEPSGG